MSKSNSIQNYTRIGESVWQGMDKIGSDLVSMTYGSIVTELIRDYKDIKLVNTELEKMGYNIGVRLVDELLAKSGIQTCSTFKDTANVISKVGFKAFLGINAEVRKWSEDEQSCSLIFKGNPFNDYVELPPQYGELNYSSLICGVIRGALNMVNIVSSCEYLKDELKGDDTNEIRIVCKDILEETYDAGDDD